MVTKRYELPKLNDFAQSLTDDSTSPDALHQRLADSDIHLEKHTDIDTERPEIPRLTLSLCHGEILAIENFRESTIEMRDEAVSSEDLEIRNTQLGNLHEFNECIRQLSIRVTGIYHLAHHFADIAENRNGSSIEDWSDRVSQVRIMGSEHLPDRSIGFHSMLCVNSVGGIENWELVRDIVFELYLPSRE